MQITYSNVYLILKTISITAIMAILSGCAGMVKYAPPTAGPTATINFPSLDIPRKNLTRHNDASIFLDPYSCIHERRISSKIIKIPARKLFTFNVSHTYDDGVNYRWCEITASFVPDQGQKYIVDYDDKNNKCAVAVYEKIDSEIASGLSSNLLPVKITRRHFSESWTLDSRYCSDALSKTNKNHINKG